MRRFLFIAGFLLAGRLMAAEPVSLPSLDMPADARSAALAGAVTASLGGPESVTANPAGLAGIRHPSFILSQADLGQSMTLTEAAAAFPWGKRTVWGLGLRSFSAGSINRTDVGGNPAGDFSPKDTVAVAGVSVRLSKWAVGLAGKYVSSTLDGSAGTPAFDLGAVSVPFWKRTLRAGVSVSNLGGSLDYGGGSEPLSRVVRGGLSAVIKRRVWLFGDLAAPAGGSVKPALGAEGIVVREGDLSLLARLGWDARAAEADHGVSAGVGVRYGFLRIDYAWTPLGELGDSHRLSLAWRPGPRTTSSRPTRDGPTPGKTRPFQINP